jgi:6-phosphogluconolactonase
MTSKLTIFITIILLCRFNCNPISAQDKEFIYVGTYNEQDTPGIFVYEFNRQTGRLDLVQEVGGMRSPSYLEINPNGKYLYAVNRSSVLEEKKWASVSAYRIDQEYGKISHLNDQPSFGSESCHISIDTQGRMVFVSNYTTGNLTVFPIKENGALDVITDAVQHYGSSENKQRQTRPHVHQSILSNDNAFLFVSDLGIDKVKVYAVDYNKKKLNAIPDSDGVVSPGSGPRHATVHDNSKHAYVINELSSTVTVFNLENSSGKLTPIQTISTIPEDYNGTNYCADIHIHPSGSYLYGSNRGHNSLAIFKIDTETGKLSIIGHKSTYGEWPRNFLIDPAGEYIFVANQNTDNIVLFTVTQDTGLLEKIDSEIQVPKPVCLKILKL